MDILQKEKRMVKIYIITVIYNHRIDEIRSFPEFERFLRRRPTVSLIIADNSTEKGILEQNRVTAARNGWIRYLECGGNIGLSRAYNRAVAVIPKEEPFWVMLSDDDTKFSMEYLENGYKQIRREAEKPGKTLRVLCGIVQTEHGWISPRTEHTKELAFSWLLRQPKPGIYRDLYPVNSGLFLDGSAIREAGGFDERLFLDQVDFLMIDRLRAKEIRTIGVLPGEIRQAFSGALRRNCAAGSDAPGNKNNSTSPDIGQSSEERWKIFRKDFETYCNLTHKPWYWRVYLLGRRRLMMNAEKMLRRG